MKVFQAILVVGASLSLASAVECPTVVVPAPAPGTKTPLETACPSLYVRGENAIFVPEPETITTASLAALEPCKDTTCLTELKKNSPTTECTALGLYTKVYHDALVTLCEAFNAGPVTVETAKSLLLPAIVNTTEAAPSSNVTTPPATTTAAAMPSLAPTTTETTTPPTTKPADSATAPTVAPTTTPKSAAGSVVATGAAVVVAASVLQWLA